MISSCYMYMVPAKASGSQNVSARSTRCPCAASQSPASRRVIRDRKKEARFGNTPGSDRIRNRVLFATISSRRNCCSGLQPHHLSRGAHLKAPFRRAARPGQRFKRTGFQDGLGARELLPAGRPTDSNPSFYGRIPSGPKAGVYTVRSLIERGQHPALSPKSPNGAGGCRMLDCRSFSINDRGAQGV